MFGPEHKSMLKYQCSNAMPLDNDGPTFNRTNRRRQWHIFPYSGTMCLHPALWRYSVGYKIHARHHDTIKN